jgi:hypothetical protein
MATENRGVMVYLPPDVEEYITSFCTEYSITRKDKEGNILPSLGTGIVTYLKSTISGESPDNILAKPSRIPGNGLSKNEVLDLISEYLTSHSPSPLPGNGLGESEVLDLIAVSTERINFRLNENEKRIDANTQGGNAASIDIASLKATVDALDSTFKATVNGLMAEIEQLKKSRAIG